MNIKLNNGIELKNEEEYQKYLNDTLLYGTAFIKDGKVLDINDVYLDEDEHALFVREVMQEQ